MKDGPKVLKLPSKFADMPLSDIEYRAGSLKKIAIVAGSFLLIGAGILGLSYGLAMTVVGTGQVICKAGSKSYELFAQCSKDFFIGDVFSPKWQIGVGVAIFFGSAEAVAAGSISLHRQSGN